MSSSTSKSHAAILAQVQALIAGTTKHTPSSTFMLDGVSYTAASLNQLFQSLATAITAVVTSDASAKTAVTALDGLTAKVAPVMLSYKRLLQTTYGSDLQTLTDYGLAPRKAPKPRTSEQNAAAKAKAAATREARGTKGAKQKAQITGNVTGVTVTPVTEPAPAAEPAQLATATPSANPAPKS